METDKLNALIDHLNKLGHGKILDSDKADVLNLLSLCWHALQGSDDQKTYADKLNRAEKLSWDGSILSFTLERHGGTVNGSSRADLHHWVVDFHNRCANIVGAGARQLYPMSPKMNFKAIAEEVANQILSGEKYSTIRWHTDDHIILNISEIIPETYKDTTKNRRKRFREELEIIMLTHNWSRKDHGNKMGFVRPSTT